MKILLSFFAATLMSIVAHSAATSESRQILCEGDIAVLINPTQKTVQVAIVNDEFIDIPLYDFEKVRGIDTYRASGIFPHGAALAPFSLNTVWRPDKPLTANVRIGDEPFVLTCTAITLPDL